MAFHEYSDDGSDDADGAGLGSVRLLEMCDRYEHNPTNTSHL